MSLVLGIDLGTSSVKAVVAGIDGRVLAQSSAGYPVEHPRPGWAETDPEAWWAAVVEAVRAACAGHERDIAGIGLSGQMHGLVALDADARPLRPAMLWADGRATAEVEAYRALGDDALARLANPLFPGMAGPMWLWLSRHEPAVSRRIRWVVQPKDWLRARLTGRVAADPSDASATLLYDLAADTWATGLVNALGLDPAALPPLLPHSGAAAGALTPGAAEALGLRAGVPVAAGAGDTAAAAYGAGMVPGDAQLTIGSGAQLIVACATPMKVRGDDPPTPRLAALEQPTHRSGPLPTPAQAQTRGDDSPAPRLVPLEQPTPPTTASRAAHPVTHLYRAATAHGWYEMAAILGGGLTLDWVRATLGATWDELYAAAAIAPSPDDPLFLPQLHGERTPYLDAGLRGAWLGLDPRHDRTTLLRAALEGVALSLRLGLDSLRHAPDDQTSLTLAGGGTTSPAWRQLLADVLGRPLCPAEMTGASGLGAAMLGARAAGLITEADALATLRPAPTPPVAPRPEYASHYAARLPRFDAAVRALRPILATNSADTLQSERETRQATLAQASEQIDAAYGHSYSDGYLNEVRDGWTT